MPLLAKIFDVIQSDNSVNKVAKIPNEADKLKEDAATSMNNIQKVIEYEIELDRVERLRKPKFHTMPAYEKRAKQESQWRAARRASALHSSAPYKLPTKFSGGSSSELHTVVLPILTKDPVEASSSLDVSSLDIVFRSSSSNPISSTISPTTASHLSSQQVDIIQSSLMVNT